MPVEGRRVGPLAACAFSDLCGAEPYRGGLDWRGHFADHPRLGVNDTVKLPGCGKVKFPTSAIVGFQIC